MIIELNITQPTAGSNLKSEEYILCAAIKRKKPIKLDSYNYQTDSKNPDDIYSIEIGRRHNDILARFCQY